MGANETGTIRVLLPPRSAFGKRSCMTDWTTQTEQARSWFARARGHPSTRKEADVWLKYLDRELRSG